MGLVTNIVTAETLETATFALAAEIAANAPRPVAASKAMVNALSDACTTVDLKALDPLIQACFDSADYAEGRRAFLEKRKPVFTGT